MFFESEYCNNNCHTIHPTYLDPSSNRTHLNFSSSAFASSSSTQQPTFPAFQVSESKSTNSHPATNSSTTPVKNTTSARPDSEKEVPLPKELIKFKDVFSECKDLIKSLIINYLIIN